MASTTNHLRERVLNIYEYIQDHLYFNRPDLQIDGREFNSTILFGLLTGLTQGKELIIGEPGLGKTTSAEYISSLLYGFPLGTIWASEVSGHPEQTEEKIIGRPDLGRLNQGEEVVVWSYFVLLPVKIVDEINRLPETKQSMILDGVDRGNWEYLNDAIINNEYCLFATANYQDRGTNTVIAPLIDRFDVMVESKHPGPNLAYLIGSEGTSDEHLRDEAFEAKFHRLLSQRIPYEQLTEEIESLCSEYSQVVEDRVGIRPLSRAERRELRLQMEEIPFDLDFNAFFRVVLSELSFCRKYGQKRSHEDCEQGCHFTNYLCHSIRNCVSNRLPLSVRKFSRALGWLLGIKEVGLEQLRLILPFTLAHRLQWKEDAIAKREKEVRSDPLNIHMAKEAAREMHRRYMEQGEQIKKALAVACRIVEGESLDPMEGDHPIYWDIRRDLGELDARA